MGYETDCRDAKNRIGTMLAGDVVAAGAGLRTHLRRGERTWLGSLLGKGMTLTPWVPVEGDSCSYLGAVTETARLNLIDLPTVAEAEAIRTERLRELAAARADGQERNIQVAMRMAVWADKLVEAADAYAPTTWDFVLQAIRINDLVLLGISAETFAATGLAIKARSPFPHTQVLGYTNGVSCYLPPAHDYPAGGWSVRGRYQIPDLVFQSYLLPTGLRPDSEQRVVDRSLALIQLLA